MTHRESLFSNYRMIDLTHTLDEKTPTWSGRCGFHAHLCKDYPEGCRVMRYDVNGGTGTHLDAPVHFIRDAADVAELPVEQLIGPLCVLHLDVGDNADYQVSCDDLRRYEAAHGRLPSGSLVVAHTGWAERWRDPTAYRNEDAQGVMHFPTLSKAAAEYLLEAKIAGIGIDTLSPDGCTSDFPVHHLLLGHGIYIIENLTNLAKVPSSGAYAIALPPKIAGAPEAPCRVIALVPQLGTHRR